MHEVSAGAACVIGGTGGLGKAVCRCLGRDWEAVFFTYRSRHEEGRDPALELSAHCRAACAYADVRNAESVTAALRAAKERFGSVGTVIFAAGVNILRPYVSEVTPQE